jgi:glucose dehydrogenase
VLCDSLGDGYLAAFDANSGREIWRTKREAHPSWSTPAIYEGAGHAELVINAAPFVQGHDPSNGDETTMATPALAADTLFVRTEHAVWALADSAPGSHQGA